MKRFLLVATVAVSVFVVPALAMHEHEAGHKSMPMMMPDMTRAQLQAKIKASFAEVDTNKDGAITQAEIKAYRDSRQMSRIEDHFKAMDTNGDGSISHDEFVAAHKAMEGAMAMGREGPEGAAGDMGPPPPPMMHGAMGDHAMGMKMGEKMFDKADANKDGKVTLAEATKAALQHFDAMDANRDGKVTAGERMDFMRAMMKSGKAAKGDEY